MKRKYGHIIALLLLLGPLGSAMGQNGGFSLSGGLASSQMDDMKYLLEHILGSYPVEGRVTSSFPPYTTGSLVVFSQLYDHIRVGGGYTYTTTGGKSSYADYSGNISTEINATSHRLGAYLAYRVLGGDRLELDLNGRLDANFTSMTVESYYKIYNYGNGLTNQYRSISPSGSIGAELMYNLGKISLGVEGGYLVDMKGKLKDTNDGNPLLDPNDTERTLRSDWTGWYAQLKIMIGLDF